MRELKDFRKMNELTQDELGEFLDMKKSFISKVENGREKLPAIKLQKLLHNDRGWDTSILTEPCHSQYIGDHSNGNTQIIEGSIGGVLSGEKRSAMCTGTVPVIPYRLYNESGCDILKYIESNEVQRTPAVAQFAQTTCMYLVTTSAMSPAFLPGDYLALKVIGREAPIINGEAYAIDTDQLGIVIRYVYDRGDYLEMRSSADRYETFDLPKSQIYNIFRVIGLLRTNM